MNATLSPVGASAYQSAGRVSNPAQSARKSLTYRKTLNGLLAYRHGSPVAWIVSGFYKGQSANIRFFVNKKRLSFCFLELLSSGGIVHNGAVECCTRHAKFRDCYPIQRRQNRNDTSGYAKSVYFTERGLKSGSWGIQHGISRNNHVVYLCSDSRTRKLILQPAKTYKGITVMNATLSPVGASAYPSAGRVSNPAQSARKSLSFLYSLFAVQLAVEGNA
jgi:hypothetical protein